VYIPVHTVAARSRLRSADHGDLIVPRVLSRFGCHSFRVSGPTIWNDLPVDFRSTDITREQFKRSLKSWLFECAYGRRHVWETVQSEGAPKKWTYLLTYLCIRWTKLPSRFRLTPTLPNIVCLLFSSGVAANVKKNWLPLSWGPALAIATRPRRTNLSRECNSSWTYVAA